MAASSASACVIVPPRFGTVARWIQSGKYEGTFFWKKPLSSMPFGNAWSASGRPATYGSITGATRS